MTSPDDKYFNFTTFRKSGEEVSTPVWMVDIGAGRLGFTTQSGSGKVRRLRNNPEVRIQPCNARGVVRPGSTPRSGQAEALSQGPVFDEVFDKIGAKYSWQLKLTGAIHKLFQKRDFNDTAIVISLDPAKIT